jgi:vitamin B12 transporter
LDGLIINKLINIVAFFLLFFPGPAYSLPRQEVRRFFLESVSVPDPGSEQGVVDNVCVACEDTTGSPTVQLPEILVTATRFRGSPEFSPSSISSLNSTLLRTLPARTVGEAISALPGLFLRGYGGRQGIQTVAIRGASTEQTLVLLDGMRISNPQTGVTDLSLLSTSGIERVDVLRGGQSALYGADALGGVINIITEGPADSLEAEVQVAGGSSGYQAGRLALSGTAGVVGLQGSLLRERGSGDFGFLYDDGRTRSRLSRRGADYSLLSGDLRATYPLGFGIQGSTGVSFTDAGRGAPGAVTRADQPSGARLTDRIIRLRQTIEVQQTAGWNGTLRLLGTESNQSYVDPTLTVGAAPLRSAHELHTLFVNPEVAREFSPAMALVTGLELGRNTIGSTEAGDAGRWQQSIYAGTRHTLRQPDAWPAELVVYPSLRYDTFSGQSGDVSPKLGVSISMLSAPRVQVRASVGKSFRVPTFNELYWNPGGNPALSPERSIAVDAGCSASVGLVGVWTADISAFSLRTRNKITWTPGSAGIWSPRNSGSVSSRGIEAELQWSDPSGSVQFSCASTWVDARKLSEDFPGDPGKGNTLPYSPPRIIHVAASVHAAGMDIHVAHSIVSYRYITEANDRILPGYAVTDAAMRYGWSVGAFRPFFRVAVTNLFDTAYESFPQYPMPLREIIVTIGGEL